MENKRKQVTTDLSIFMVDPKLGLKAPRSIQNKIYNDIVANPKTKQLDTLFVIIVDLKGNLIPSKDYYYRDKPKKGHKYLIVGNIHEYNVVKRYNNTEGKIRGLRDIAFEVINFEEHGQTLAEFIRNLNTQRVPNATITQMSKIGTNQHIQGMAHLGNFSFRNEIENDACTVRKALDPHLSANNAWHIRVALAVQGYGSEKDVSLYRNLGLNKAYNLVLRQQGHLDVVIDFAKDLFSIQAVAKYVRQSQVIPKFARFYQEYVINGGNQLDCKRVVRWLKNNIDDAAKVEIIPSIFLEEFGYVRRMAVSYEYKQWEAIIHDIENEPGY